MNKPNKTLTAVLSTILVAVVVLFVSLTRGTSSKNIQPIIFDHKIHTETAALKCVDCHRFVEKNASAEIPKQEVCQTCHGADPISQSPEEKKLLEYIAEGKEVPWRQIYKVPPHVYFSHRRHVVRGKLECSVCHGDMSAAVVPVSSQAVTISMKNCMNCHREKKITIDCLACHR
jgi:hypothetical protein